ncbi:rod shape-determining protein MreD [Alkalimarinus sediminis]|uniref:Rod shape-determining protein MreD n=1 Tax=Alkalimarinus sediminis TaxID=1632866 RepID=A0A9E8HNE7_9ALTE|nr:rod shape-determining protein MreD [Alkalimarinus sediminis]UZW73496.1 rod shape-determining protein MreD [Alkalimarinus sediminis]
MAATRASSVFIFFSFSVAFLFSILALPHAVSYLRPEWVAMVVVYWVIKSPAKVGVVVAWSSGLVLDVLEGSLLGVNALSLAVVAYLVLTMHQRIKLFPLIQQSFTVFLVVGIHLMIGHFIRNVVDDPVSGMAYLIPALSSAIVWPVMSLFIDKVAIKLR